MTWADLMDWGDKPQNAMVVLVIFGLMVVLADALTPVVQRWRRERLEAAKVTRVEPSQPWPRSEPCPVCRGGSAKVHPGEKYPRVTCSLCNNTGEAPDDR